MTSARMLAVVVATMSLLCGCAADRDTRELASRLRKLTAEYDSLATKKTAAERQFYIDSLKNLDQTLNVVPLGAAPDQNAIKNTVAYGRIITRAHYDSLRLAETLIGGDALPFTAGAISDFIRDGVRADEEAYRQVRQMQAAIAESLVNDFAKLAEYQKKIGELARGLADLEKTPDSSTRARQLRAIGEAVWMQLRADKDAVR